MYVTTIIFRIESNVSSLKNISHFHADLGCFKEAVSNDLFKHF